MEHLVKLLRDSYDLQEEKSEKTAYWHLQHLRSEIKQLILSGVSQQRELLKVLEYTRQIKNNPKDIQLIVDKLYVENL